MKVTNPICIAATGLGLTAVILNSIEASGPISNGKVLKWNVSHSAEVNENINLGYSQDQGYS